MLGSLTCVVDVSAGGLQLIGGQGDYLSTNKNAMRSEMAVLGHNQLL